MLTTVQYTVSHAFCVASAALGYLVWADIGNALTNHKAYFWMDPRMVGSHETVMLYCLGFVGLSGAGESRLHYQDGARLVGMSGSHSSSFRSRLQSYLAPGLDRGIREEGDQEETVGGESASAGLGRKWSATLWEPK
jgi:hypothetical protein